MFRIVAYLEWIRSDLKVLLIVPSSAWGMLNLHGQTD